MPHVLRNHAWLRVLSSRLFTKCVAYHADFIIELRTASIISGIILRISIAIKANLDAFSVWLGGGMAEMTVPF